MSIHILSWIGTLFGRQIHNKSGSWLCLCHRSPCAFEQLNDFNCDVSVTYLLIPFTTRTRETVWSFKQGFGPDNNTITSFVRIEFYIQDWADFRVRANPPSGSGCFLQVSRLCVFSRHADCITSDPSSIVMKNCPFPVSFKKPAPEHSCDNF